MNLKKILFWLGGIAIIIGVGVGSFFVMYVRPVMKEIMTMKTVPFDKELTLVLGGGGNSGILTSDSLVLIVDTKMDDAAKTFHEEVKQIAGTRPIIIINTHVHKDHTGGNKLFKGQTIMAGGNYDKAFWISDAGEQSLPAEWVKDSMTIKVGNEIVTVLNLGFSAHTQSDVVVYLNNRKLIFTGDLVLNKKSPAMFKKYDASSSGYMKAFDLMEKQFDIKTVVPGHGDTGGVEIIDNFRQFFSDMKTGATDASKKNEMVSKYKDWRQVPFIMSPASTISYIKGEQNK